MNIECGRALRVSFPEPPFVDFGQPSSLDKRMMKDFCQPLSIGSHSLPEVESDQMVVRVETANSVNWAALRLIVVFCVAYIVHKRRVFQRFFCNRFLLKETLHTESANWRGQHQTDSLQPHKAVCQGNEPSPTSSASELALAPILVRRRFRAWDTTFTDDMNIWRAASQGSVVRIQKCLARGVDVDATSDYGRTPLVIASTYGRLEAVEHLLSMNAEVDLRDSSHSNALDSASMRGHGSVVRHLLTHGATTSSGALRFACQQGHEHIVRILIDWGTNVNSYTAKYPPPLRAAASGGYTDIVELLLQNGAASLVDVMIDALEDAAWNGHEKVVRLFLDLKIKTEAYELRIGFALLAAADGKHESIVDFLLSRLSHVTVSKEDLPAILIVAAEKGFKKIVVALLKLGVGANRQRNNRRAIEVAAGAGHREIVSALLDHGAAIDSPLRHSGSLESAARGGYQDVVLELLRRGADVNARCFYDHTPLSSAAFHGHEVIVEILLTHGADPNAKGHCCSNALKSAVKGGHATIVGRLLLQGADVNAECIFCGNTLRCAMSKSNPTIVNLLLDEGAELSTKEAYLPNPLRGSSFASFKGPLSMIELSRADDDGFAETNTSETPGLKDKSFPEDPIFSMEM